MRIAILLAAASLALIACEPAPPTPAPPPAPERKPAPPSPSAPTPLPSDPAQLKPLLETHYAKAKLTSPEALMPGETPPPRPPTGGPSVTIKLKASGGYSEISLEARCWPKHRTYVVKREHGALRGTVFTTDGPFLIPEGWSAD